MRFIKIAFAIVILWFLGHTAWVTWDGLHDRLVPVDIAIVLGTNPTSPGEPSNAQRTRLDRTISLYQQGYFKKILVSGSNRPKDGQQTTVMKTYLIDHGIPESAITEDPTGYNTRLTAKNFRDHSLAHGSQTFMVISQFFHLPRIKFIFTHYGLKPDGAAHGTAFYLWDLFDLGREFMAFYLKYLPYTLIHDPNTPD